MKKPRVMVDCRMVLSAGVGTYIRHLLPLLAQDSPYDFFFLGRREELSAFTWADPGRIIRFETPVYSPLEHVVLYRLLQRFSPDLFWSPHYNVPLLGRGLRLATIHDVFHISRENQEWGRIKKGYARALLSAAMRRSALVLTDSAFTLEEIKRYGLPCAEKVRVIPLGVAMPDCPKERGNGSYFLFVGNVKPHKNLRRLVEAYAIARASGGINLPMKIVGETDRFFTGERGLPDLARSLGVGQYIEFTGRVGEKELEALYAGALALVFPSIYEGFGLPPLEAMARGVPVLASNAASLPEVCGDAALYFDPTDAKEIAKKMALIATDGGLREALARRGLSRARMFTWEASAKKTAKAIAEAFYESAINK